MVKIRTLVGIKRDPYINLVLYLEISGVTLCGLVRLIDIVFGTMFYDGIITYHLICFAVQATVVVFVTTMISVVSPKDSKDSVTLNIPTIMLLHGTPILVLVEYSCVIGLPVPNFYWVIIILSVIQGVVVGLISSYDLHVKEIRFEQEMRKKDGNPESGRVRLTIFGYPGQVSATLPEYSKILQKV